MAFDRIEDASRAVDRGEMVVVVDDEDRENEGDLILVAEHATPEAIAFMIRYTSGMLCVALPRSLRWGICTCATTKPALARCPGASPMGRPASAGIARTWSFSSPMADVHGPARNAGCSRRPNPT